MSLPKEMATRGLVISCSEARRLIATGHVAMNGELVEDICAEANRGDDIEIVRKRDVNSDGTLTRKRKPMGDGTRLEPGRA